MSAVYKFVKNLFFPSLIYSHAIFPGGHLHKHKNIIRKIHSTYNLAYRIQTKNDQSFIEPIFELEWIGL